MRTLPLALVLLSQLAPEAGAQTIPVVEPGAVVTVTVAPPSSLASARDREGRLTLAYALETAAAVRAIGQKSGNFSWEAGEEARFPVTLRVPDRAEAGERTLAFVAFQSETGESASVPVRIRVRAVREVDVQLVRGRDAASRGEAVLFTYVLTNHGNAGDSVSLSLETNLGAQPDVIPGTVWLAPYQEKTGSFRLSVPPDQTPGSEIYVRLSARLAGRLVSGHATVAVLPERGLFPDLVQIPSTVFIGSTVTSFDGARRAEPVVSVAGNGKLGRHTELLFNYRYMPRGGSVFAFRGLLSGPRAFLGIQRPTWGAAAGDLNVRTSDLLGFQLQGRGLQGVWSSGRFSVRGMAARPTGLDGTILDGHVTAAEIGVGSGSTKAAILATSTERSDALGSPESSVEAALGRLQIARGDHWLGVDVGPMKVGNRRTSETELGPSVDARYQFRGSGGDLTLVYRKLPDLQADPRLPPTEMRAIGTVRATRALSASGTLYDEAVPQSLQFAGTRARGARGGVRWNEAHWTVGLTGELRTVRGTVEEARRLGRVDATLRTGDFTFDASLGLGTARIGDASELAELYRLGGSWLTDRGLVTFHVTITDDLLQPTSTLLDAYGVYRLNERIELYGTATTFVILESEGFAPRSISDGLTLQTGARLRLSASRSIYTGIERFSPGGSEGARWRLSVGIQQGIPLPLPLRRPPAASGVVFEDLNGDGRRGEDEPGLDGIMLRMGFERTVSLADGRFEFRDAEPEPIEIDPRSLADDFVPMAPVRVPPTGMAEIGLYRAGSLHVALFFDANGDGAWNESELPAPGVSVSLSRGDEPWVLRTGSDGSVSLSSLAPGTYVIQVDRETLPSRALPADVRSVDVRGGEASRVQVPIPMRQINFSSFGDGGTSCAADTAVCDDD